jgi:hypothetical protein
MLYLVALAVVVGVIVFRPRLKELLARLREQFR